MTPEEYMLGVIFQGTSATYNKQVSLYGKFEMQPPEKEQALIAAGKLKLANYRSRGSFHFTYIEKQQCYIIAGYYEDKRYEVVLGNPVTKSMLRTYHEVWEKYFGLSLPTSLTSLIHTCNRDLLFRNNEYKSDKGLDHPDLDRIITKCPKCADISTLNAQIQHLNDTHKMSREAIAEWIDTLDEQPIFYPILDTESKPARVANSAKVVACKPTV